MDYYRTVKAGHLQASVRQDTDWGKGGVLHVNSTDSKSGMLVLDILRMKHPDLQEVDLDHPDCSAFEAYSACPKVFPIDITGRDVKIMVSKIGVSVGPSRTDSILLKVWCTQFSAETDDLREELVG